MATTQTELSLPTGLQSVELTSWAGDVAFSPAPVAGDILIGSDTLTINVDGTVTGADGTYDLTLIRADGSSETLAYQIGTVAVDVTTEDTYLPPSGMQAVTLTSWAGDAVFPITPTAGMQLVGSETLTINPDGTVTGADGVYDLTLLDGEADGTAYTISYQIGTVTETGPVDISTATNLNLPAGHAYVVVGDEGVEVDYTVFDDNGYTIEQRPQLGETFIYATDNNTVFYDDLSFDTDAETGSIYFCILRSDGSADAAEFTNLESVQEVEEAEVGDVTTTETYQAPTGWQVITLPEGYDNYIFNHASGTQFEFATTDKTGWQFGIEADPTKVELVLSGTDIELRIIGVDDGTGTLVKPDGIDLLNAVLIDPAGDGTAHGFDIDTTTIALYEESTVAPQGVISFGTISTTDTSVSIPFSYNDTDQTSFQYRLNSGVWTTTTSPVTISELIADTPYIIEMKAVNSTGDGTVYNTSFTTDVEGTGDSSGPTLPDVAVSRVSTNNAIWASKRFNIETNMPDLQPGHSIRAKIVVGGVNYWLTVHSLSNGIIDVTAPSGLPSASMGTANLVIDIIDLSR